MRKLPELNRRALTENSLNIQTLDFPMTMTVNCEKLLQINNLTGDINTFLILLFHVLNHEKHARWDEIEFI